MVVLEKTETEPVEEETILSPQVGFAAGEDEELVEGFHTEEHLRICPDDYTTVVHSRTHKSPHLRGILK